MACGYKYLDDQGWTSTTYYVPGDPPRVCKAFNEDCAASHYPVEKLAYERFTENKSPPSILKYHGIDESIPAAIILDFAENGNLHRFVWKKRRLRELPVKNEILLRWADQAAEALEFAHSLGVYNSDIHCINFFLDQNWDLKVGDWAGASIDGSRSESSYRRRHRLFDEGGTDVPRSTGITAATEIFALGTALYHMVAGHDPWLELKEPGDREEIKNRISNKAFPDTSSLPALGDVIKKCWHVEFASMTEVRHGIEAAKQLGELC